MEAKFYQKWSKIIKKVKMLSCFKKKKSQNCHTLPLKYRHNKFHGQSVVLYCNFTLIGQNISCLVKTNDIS